jgi:CMP-N,N'-diacetyllegionaminic acid synthase
MTESFKILAVIPARGGSKGLPNKNLRPLLGKPLIAWSIEQALGSKYINEVFVSTDSEEIAQVARAYKAKVPFLRPIELATDEAKTSDVLLHFIKEIEKQNNTFTHILLLEPTSPLRETQDIDKAFEMLIRCLEATSVVGISKVEAQHPSFTINLTEDQFLRSKNNFRILRRQDIEDLYFYEGSVYISTIEKYKELNNFYHNNTLGYVMPKWKSFEIDDIVDFVIVEALLNNKEILKKHE